MLNWKNYFIFIIAYKIFTFLYLFINSIEFFMYVDVIHWVFTIGVWGFSYKKRIVSRYLWLFVFWFSIVIYFHSWVIRPLLMFNNDNSIITIMFTIMFSLPLIIIPYILFKYSHKSNKLWYNT